MDKIPQIRAINDRAAQRMLDSESPTQMEYELILQDIADIRASKVKSYGEAAYNHDDKEEDIMRRFLDIERKFCRLQELSRAVRGGDLSQLPLLVDGYRDIANYGILGIQVLERHFPKQPIDLS